MSPTLDLNKITGGLMLAALANPPVAFPQVSIGGEFFELRYTLRSTFFLEQSGQLGAQTIQDWLADHYKDKRTTSAVMIMVGSMLGREIAGKWKPKPITGEEISERLTLEEWNAIGEAYGEALKKVTEAMTQALDRLKGQTEPTPTPDQTPVIN